MASIKHAGAQNRSDLHPGSSEARDALKEQQEVWGVVLPEDYLCLKLVAASSAFSITTRRSFMPLVNSKEGS